MMALDTMYLRDPEPLVLTVELLNVWPPAPGIPDIGPLRAGQLDDELRRVDTHSVDVSGWGMGLHTTELHGHLLELAEVHGRITVAITTHQQRVYDVGVWISQ